MRAQSFYQRKHVRRNGGGGDLMVCDNFVIICNLDTQFVEQYILSDTCHNIGEGPKRTSTSNPTSKFGSQNVPASVETHD